MAKAIPRISIPFLTDTTAQVRQSNPASISANPGVCQGLLCLIKVVTPTFTVSRTTTIRIFDRNGICLYASGALAEASGATGIVIQVNIPLTYGEYVTAQPSGAPGTGGGTVTIDMDYIPDHFMEVY